jgi:DNA-directed RNA polymerase specialized sigma subunit
MMGRIQDQEWFRQTITELREYRVLVKRVQVIRIQLMKEAGPDEKVIANYSLSIGAGNNPDEISRLEVELVDKETRIKSIDTSLESLEPREKEIIELKFKKGKKDQEIYGEILQISSQTFYGIYNGAIEKIAKCLGFLEC